MFSRNQDARLGLRFLPRPKAALHHVQCMAVRRMLQRTHNSWEPWWRVKVLTARLQPQRMTLVGRNEVRATWKKSASELKHVDSLPLLRIVENKGSPFFETGQQFYRATSTATDDIIKLIMEWSKGHKKESAPKLYCKLFYRRCWGRLQKSIRHYRLSFSMGPKGIKNHPQRTKIKKMKP